MPKFVVVHRKDLNNVGDMASNPLQYFCSPDDYISVDITKIRETQFPDDIPMIIGGGGLLGNEFIGDFHKEIVSGWDRMQLDELWRLSWVVGNLKYQSLNQEFNEKYHNLIKEYLDQIPYAKRFKALWGVGHNGDPDTEWENIRWPKYLSDYNLIGSRDYNLKSRFNYVPCASCMHPALRKNHAIKNDMIIFEHKKQLIRDFPSESIPRFVNSGSNIDQTIELLGSANIIFTNSYHGAYWGSLMKKRVVLVGGIWSSKFKWLKYQPVIAGKKDSWLDLVDQSKSHQGALEESIAINEKFYKKILEKV